MSIESLKNKNGYSFEDLLEIMDILRSENGCPWDKEQDHKSIRNNFIEEVYEAVEGIDNNDSTLLKEELGDVLLQVVFHAKIAKDEKEFDINDVLTGICKKLILRHPHIFGDIKVGGSDDVLKNWDEIKKIEKKQKSKFDVLNSVARSFPSLVRAQKIYHKSKENISEETIINRINKNLMQINSSDDKKIIMGEILFDAASLCDNLKIDAEECLYMENDRAVTIKSKW